MHILHSLFSNGIGGTERHLADLANAQVKMGHKVTVMLRADRHPYAGLDSFREWLMPQVQIISVPRRWPLLPLFFKLRQLRPDIIHTHHRRDSRYLGLAAPREVPVVGTLHMPFRAQDYRRHQGLICVAPWQLADVPNLPSRHRVVIPNWIMPSPPVSEEERKALRRRAGVTDQRPLLLGAVGRLTAEKGLEDLVEAFIQANPSGVKLCIFGEGECRPALERRIAEAKRTDIELMGYEPDIRHWYAAFDGFVLPSRYETFGLVLLEAISAGLPILATRTRGALDVLGKHSEVVWAEANHPINLAEALVGFFPQLGKRYDYPQLTQYQPQQAFEKVMDFYKKLLPASFKPVAQDDGDKVHQQQNG